MLKRKTLFVGIAVFLAALAAAVCLVYPRAPAAPERGSNVILITCDSLRPDHLSCYGYNIRTSPAIDELAKESFLFTRAVGQGSKTPLSLPSLFTSTYPRTHGVYREGYAVRSSLPCIAQTLKDNGYLTCAIAASIGHIKGLERGFDVFISDYSPERHFGDLNTLQACEWISGHKDKKFFLWLHYFNTHSPYRPPEPYKSKFARHGGKNVPVNLMSESAYSGYRGIPRAVAEDGISDAEYYISQYDGAIAYTDKQLGRLLGHLRSLGIYDKTLIILSADHGEALGERDLYFQHGTLYDEIVRVPLLIKAGHLRRKCGVIKRQVQLIDLFPTILGLLGVDNPATVQGTSLVPLLSSGRQWGLTPFAFSECARESESAREWDSVRTERWKLMCRRFNRTTRYELYDLLNDPQETENIVLDRYLRYLSLKRELLKWRKKYVPSRMEKMKDMDQNTVNVLKSLGYLQ